MIQIRNDLFATYLGVEGRFWKRAEDDLYRIQVNKEQVEKKELFVHFKKYDRYELSNKLYVDVKKEQINSAYRVITFCNYNGGLFDIGPKITNDTVFLFPDLETKKKLGFHYYEFADVQIPYSTLVNDVLDIWEEREPIEDFIFDVEPIKYLKKDGVWLVEHDFE